MACHTLLVLGAAPSTPKKPPLPSPPDHPEALTRRNP